MGRRKSIPKSVMSWRKFSTWRGKIFFQIQLYYWFDDWAADTRSCFPVFTGKMYQNNAPNLHLMAKRIQ